MRTTTLVLSALALLLCACAQATPEATATSLPPEPAADTYPPMVCSAISSPPEPVDFLSSLGLDPISDQDWQQGPSDAAITILEYGDFQCPSCAKLSEVLNQLLAEYPDDFRLVFRHYPLLGTEELPVNDKDALAMQAAEAAGQQDAFWEMYAALYARLDEWINLTPDEFTSWLNDLAGELDLDVAQFEQDAYNEQAAADAQKAWDTGQKLGITPPFVFIAGIPYTGPLDFNSLDGIVKELLLPQRQFHECPAMQLEQGVSYTATLHTEKGDIVLQLYPEVAPKAVNSFIFLAEHGWFDNVTFHRVIPGFVAQAGDPTGTGRGNPGYLFSIETDSNFTFDRAGLLAMANSGPTANGSQFFITLAPAEHLNGGYTIFGEVIDGMDVVESLSERDPSQNTDLPPGDLILDVSIEER